MSVSLIGFSQTNHDERLLDRYTEVELNELQKNNPEEYEIINHALKVGISIGDIQEGKDLKFDGTLDKDPNLPHTYISLGLKLENRYQYYKFKGTNKMVIVRPKDKITLIK
ncbi:hypothetical protein DXU93_02195 [Brumimicrobium aurantiacum]|uniref:Uncharacterized protein n=1 Tax=Brumimicrobium aurantiacum TaxID=1737063 RepID=A0A3E1F1R9_9FLAO|nr:hypothetical protein DXU93_02195 [Brumimicrobium aurantiacum]